MRSDESRLLEHSVHKLFEKGAENKCDIFVVSLECVAKLWPEEFRMPRNNTKQSNLRRHPADKMPAKTSFEATGTGSEKPERPHLNGPVFYALSGEKGEYFHA